MDRYWLLTSTTYGTWLPGDPRGFVGYHTGPSGQRSIHNIPGEPYDADLPELREAAGQRLKCAPIHLNLPQAETLFAQFRETAQCRGWLLLAVAITSWHFHMVVGVDGDPDPERVLGDFKAYGSRALSQTWEKPANGTWWTTSGSKRKLRDDASVAAAIAYVQQQESPLVVWVNPAYLGEQAG